MRRKPITEAEFLAQVMALAALRGWWTFHQRPARTLHGWRSAVQGHGKGFPDLFAVRGPRAVALELKSRRGRLTEEQRRWIEALQAAGIEAGVFRPEQWDVIERLLA